MSLLVELIKKIGDNVDADIAIVGIPYDKGVVIEKGRPGAALAPRGIRDELAKYHKLYNLKHDVDLSDLKIADIGDIEVSGLEPDDAHAKIHKNMKGIFDKYPVVIVLGGGHDVSYSTVRGLCESEAGDVFGVNLDAHADVKDRDDFGSGTPFGRLIREGILKGGNFAEMGMHDNFATRDDIDFLKKEDCKILPLSFIEEKGIDLSVEKAFRPFLGPSFLSIDIDAVAEAFAPGCSAPSSDGFTPNEIIRASYLAGKERSLRLFEIMEVNPKFDIDNRTCRLAATMITAFLTGLAKSRKIVSKI